MRLAVSNSQWTFAWLKASYFDIFLNHLSQGSTKNISAYAPPLAPRVLIRLPGSLKTPQESKQPRTDPGILGHDLKTAAVSLQIIVWYIWTQIYHFHSMPAVSLLAWLIQWSTVNFFYFWLWRQSEQNSWSVWLNPLNWWHVRTPIRRRQIQWWIHALRQLTRSRRHWFPTLVQPRAQRSERSPVSPVSQSVNQSVTYFNFAMMYVRQWESWVTGP